jgi:hypothetical protein
MHMRYFVFLIIVRLLACSLACVIVLHYCSGIRNNVVFVASGLAGSLFRDAEALFFECLDYHTNERTTDVSGRYDSLSPMLCLCRVYLNSHQYVHVIIDIDFILLFP